MIAARCKYCPWDAVAHDDSHDAALCASCVGFHTGCKLSFSDPRDNSAGTVAKCGVCGDVALYICCNLTFCKLHKVHSEIPISGKYHDLKTIATFWVCKKSQTYNKLCGCSVCKSLGDVQPAKFAGPVTQKAAGIYAIKTNGCAVFSSKYVLNTDTYPTVRLNPPTHFPFFARPCPERPRHGFVDSRVINNAEEFSKLVDEVKAASGEDKWEIVVGPLIDADWSAVITETGISIGPGNDGATSGRQSFFIHAPAKDMLQNLRIGALAAINESPYIEVVHGAVGVEPRPSTEIVQVRDGPKPESSSKRYVPEEMTVTAVVLARGDLLGWEKKVHSFRPGTVVWHPGGTMVSHYAIHCIANKIPILCDSEEPKVGDRLSPETCIPILSADDYNRLAQYIVAYDSWIVGRFSKHDNYDDLYDDVSESVATAVAIMHTSPLWGPDDGLLRLRAFGVMITLRASAMALYGENRHFFHGPLTKKYMPYTRKIDIDGFDSVLSDVARDKVYLATYDFSFDHIVNDAKTLILDFRQPGWDGDVGGESWAMCAVAVLRLGRKIANFVRKPCEKNWKFVMEAWNYVIDVTHNNGALLTKFILSSYLDMCNRCPGVFLASSQTYDVIYNGPKPVEPIKSVRKIGRAMSFAAAIRRGTVYQRRIVEIPAEIIAVAAKQPPPFGGKKYPKYHGARAKLVFNKMNPYLHIQAEKIAVADLETNRPYGYAINVITDTKTAEAVKGSKYGEVLSLQSHVYNYAKCKITKIDGEKITVTMRGANGKLITIIGDMKYEPGE